MTCTTISARPITAEAFAPFGEVIEAGRVPPKMINQGRCARYSDLATLDIAEGHAGLSLFQSERIALPYLCDLLERHPLGSQAFIPMTQGAFLVIVAEDTGNRPGKPLAFLTEPGQAINIHRNTWHGVLTPIEGSGLFAVVDRIGTGRNLEEYRLEEPVLITTDKKTNSHMEGQSHG